MKEIIKPKETFTVELTLDEIVYLNVTTQNKCIPDEDKYEHKLRLGIFVATSRMLGIDMNDDGTNKRSVK